MSRGFFRRESEIERTLRSARPHASGELLDRLASRAKAVPARAPRRLGMRLAGAAGVTALMVAGLAATGGMSYAASTVDHVVAQVTHHSTFMGARMAVAVKATSPAGDQYTTAIGTASTAAVGSGLLGVNNTLTNLSGAPSGTKKTVTLGSTNTTQGGVTTTTSLTADVTSNAVSLTVSSQTSTPGSTSKKLATVSMPTSTYAAIAQAAGNPGNLDVVVDPKPQVQTIGNHPVVGVNLAFSSNGTPIHLQNLATPISVSLPPPAGGFPANYVPAYSTDGKTFTAIPKLSGTTLPAGQQTGYYVDTNGSIVILTRHTTVFAAISKVDLGVSESGRKLKKAGSGLFGDALLVHPGPAALKEVGGKVNVYPFKSLKGDAVKFDFFVDEQASAYIQVFKGSKKLPIQLHGTQIRGGTITKGGTIKTLHIPVLRPGTLPIRLRIPASMLQSGAKYRIRVAAVDFDGNKTVRFIPFTG